MRNIKTFWFRRHTPETLDSVLWSDTQVEWRKSQEKGWYYRLDIRDSLDNSLVFNLNAGSISKIFSHPFLEIGPDYAYYIEKNLPNLTAIVFFEDDGDWIVSSEGNPVTTSKALPDAINKAISLTQLQDK